MKWNVNFISRLLRVIKESSRDSAGKMSSARISSFFILGSILTSTVFFICVDIGNAILKWNNGETYTVPLDHIAIFSLILSHHLILLGIKRASDKDLNTLVNAKNNKNREQVPESEENQEINESEGSDEEVKNENKKSDDDPNNSPPWSRWDNH